MQSVGANLFDRVTRIDIYDLDVVTPKTVDSLRAFPYLDLVVVHEGEGGVYESLTSSLLGELKVVSGKEAPEYQLR